MEGGEDALYLLVNRTINGATKRYIERMETRQVLDIEDAFFVDCGLTYDGRNHATSETITLSGGIEWKYPEQVTVTAGGHSSFSAGLIGRRLRLRASDEIVRVELTGYTSPTEMTAKLLELCPESLRGVAVSDWALMATTVSGLSHLEGKTVSILADGDVHPERVVTDGSVTLQSSAAVIHVGLPYVAEMETLEIDVPGNETLLDKRKIIPSVTVYVEESRGFMAGARKGDKLYEQKPEYRQRYNAPIPLLTGPSELKISSVWDESGRVYIQQANPLPLTILAVIPEVTVSGKG